MSDHSWAESHATPPGPDTRPLREGVVIVVVREGRFLLIRRAPGIVAAGRWCFVGGSMEPGESQEQACLREFREEVGGTVRLVRRVWEWRRPGGGLLLHWWLGRLVADRLAPNKAEVAEIGWYTMSEAVGLSGLLRSNQEFLEAVGRGLALASAAE
jgi:8-oxo-dGTP diphosphatase